ncbi:MAG: DUF4290 domain-containing protein [Chitinophagales bacterium]|nr:DUF4290 domain-containing protein [Bacteroidota bacterium]MCB9043377.1 DUF4290 domain-containing protein [Chitinophagales bacterium]
MQYESKDKLILREYGRNIQKMIQLVAKIQDDRKRNIAVQEIINIMGDMNPHLRNVDDFKHMLWDHLFVMSDFKLVADSPYLIPSREDLVNKEIQMPYPQTNIKFRHYGKLVEKMVRGCIEMEDPEKKKAYIEVIASYMKMVINSRSTEGVTDDTIREDLYHISNGELTLDRDVQIKVSAIKNAPSDHKPTSRKSASARKFGRKTSSSGSNSNRSGKSSRSGGGGYGKAKPSSSPKKRK